MKYTAVNTKVRAMRAVLLSQQGYEDLLSGDYGTAGVLNSHGTLRDDFLKIAPYLSKDMRGLVEKICSDFGTVTPALLDKSNADNSSRQSLKRVFGLAADLQNILWIYRLKKFYNVNGNAVFSFLTPESYRLKPQDTAALAHAKDLESFAQAAASGVYGSVFKSLSDFTRGEQLLTHAVCKQFKKEDRFENLAVVCSYLYERWLEIKNFNAISLGLANGLAREDILPLLHL